MVDVKLVIAASETVATGMRALIDNMRPSNTSPDRLRVALFLTMAEQFEAALTLVRLGMASHAAVHVRSMLEAFVAMNLLNKDIKHVDQMKFKQLKGEMKMYEGLLKDPNLPDDIRQFVQEHMDSREPEFSALKVAGFKSKQIANEIVEAELIDLVVPYTMLCGFSHNDLAIVAMRHQGDASMTFMAPVSPHVIVSILSTALRLIIPAVESLPKISLFPEGLFEPVFQAMNNAWGGVLAAADAG